MPAEIVVLGGGVGGTLVANLLDKSLGRDVHVTVVDPTGMHDYQPGYLYVALGEAKGHWLTREERSLLRSGVDLAIEEAIRIHPDAGTVQLRNGGSLSWDYLVIATGARLVPELIPGLAEGSFEFYSLAGAERLAQALRGFHGGSIKVGVAGIPYKCPPAPVEFTMMVDGYLRRRGLRDRSEVELLSPLNRAFTIESASALIQPIMEQRGIGLTTFFTSSRSTRQRRPSSRSRVRRRSTTCWSWCRRTRARRSSSLPGSATCRGGCPPIAGPCRSAGTTASSRSVTRPIFRSRSRARPPTSRRR
jgi:sulfide:quinone oxidoreductase